MNNSLAFCVHNLTGDTELVVTLSPDFVALVASEEPENAGELFEVTATSKYHRWDPTKKRRETWPEVLTRVVNSNISLDPNATGEEAELMFRNLYHLRTYPAGRTLWIGGTEASKKWGEANFNCCFTVVDEIEDFCDIFHLLMVGAGVGFRILRGDVAKLPQLNTDIMVHQHNEGYLDPKIYPREEPWTAERGSFYQSGNEYSIVVGDSKEGWVEALRNYFHILSTTTGHVDISINYNYIRPKGSRIKTFGGRAAGPTGLKRMFDHLTWTIVRAEGKLTPLNCLDIITTIAESVLVGGIRRAALIGLGSPDDQEFIDAKLAQFLKDKPNRKKSNNSIVLSTEPALDYVKAILKRVRESWEPGFFNLKAASKRRPNAEGCNPCGEILLADKGVCNLTGTFLTSHINEDKTDFDWKSLEESHRLATRIGLRQTNITISLPKWDEVQKRDRLLGVSVTGLMDALDILGWEHDSDKAITLMQMLRFWANDEADKYSAALGVPRPLLVTCVKPEGTISLLTTKSCGMHRNYAPFFKRRYWISDSDPIGMALKELGVENRPDGDTGKTIFTFYIASGAKMAANDESALSQLRRYLNLMSYYVDHNASCTLTVGPDEWDDMAEEIYKNSEDIVAIALANKDLGENINYEFLPYEQIDESQMRQNPDLSRLAELVTKYENEEYEEKEEVNNTTKLECSGIGFCPTV